MVARIARLDPDLALLAHRNALRRDASSQPDKDNPGTTRKLLESVALDMLLDRTFRNRPVVNFQGTPDELDTIAAAAPDLGS